MKPLIYPDKVFEERCANRGIEFEDVRHYCNEGTIYEFKSRSDLMMAQALYFPIALNDPDGFRVEFWSNGDLHHMFIKYPDVD